MNCPSNLAQWAALVGVHAWPAWLTDVTTVAIVALLTGFFYGQLWAQRKRADA